MSFSRPGLRLFQATRAFRPTTIKSSLRQPLRQQTTTAQANAGNSQNYLQKLWRSEVGPKTVHFWAPIMKWGLVLAGASDFYRPPETLSLSQNCALVATGLIWTRWCFVIRPQNYFLAAVNFFLFCVGATQVTRILIYNKSLQADTLQGEVKMAAREEGKNLENIVKDPSGAAQKAAAVK